MTVIRNSFDLVLEIDKSALNESENDEPLLTEYRVSQFSAGFALNRIPTATCALAVGREVSSLEPAQAHVDADDINLMFPAKVYLTVTGSWDGVNDFDWTGAGRQVIFDGYVTGTGYSKVRGKLQFTVQLIHWLSDLAFSSTLSNQSHPSNPSDIAFTDAYSPVCGTVQTAGSSRVMAALDQFYLMMDRDRITNDLWGQCIHPILCCLAQRDALDLGLCEGGPDGKIPNDQSLAALSRMETDTDAEESCGVEYEWGNALSLGGGIIGNALAKGIRKYFGDETMKSLWHTTMWDKLIQEYGASFKFAVVPLVERALVVPYMPGIRSLWRKSIEVDDLGTIDVASFIRRPLRGVGIWAGRELRSAPYGRQTAGLYGSLGLGGCYVPDVDAKGMLLLQRAPAWLTNVIGAAADPNLTTVGAQPGAAKSPTSTATTPLPENSNLEPSPTPVEEAKNSGSLYSNLAQWIYIAEALRGRNGSVRTKFRMDIAPGSNVQVSSIGEAFVTEALGDDALRGGLVGTVQRVSLQIDAESPSASTTFHLTNLRTLAENADDRTSAAVHPLYPTAVPFTGAPLVNSFLFE